MNQHLLVVFPLLTLSISYAIADTASNTSLPSTPSSFPTWSVTPQMSSESTQTPKIAPELDTTLLPNSSHPQQNQTELLVSTQQTQGPMFQEKMDDTSFKPPSFVDSGSPGNQQWETGAGGVAFVLMKPKGQLSVGESHGAASHAMGLFLGGCGLLLCLFIWVYCAYSRGSKKELFSHHRLYEDGFDDPALFLDSPKDYDWFFYETDGYVYPTPSKVYPQPIQTLSIPALQQPLSVLETSPGKVVTSEEVQESKQPQPNSMKLECLSPANLHTGNFI